MTETSKEIVAHLSKSDLVKQLKLDPIAFMRALGNARLVAGKKAEPGTHLLTWKRGGLGDQNLYEQATIDILLDYILMLEGQLAVDAQAFRALSIQSLMTQATLNGFEKRQ
jgi:hypothetical protein